MSLHDDAVETAAQLFRIGARFCIREGGNGLGSLFYFFIIQT
jgi:hypothetical protein